MGTKSLQILSRKNGYNSWAEKEISIKYQMFVSSIINWIYLVDYNYYNNKLFLVAKQIQDSG